MISHGTEIKVFAGNSNPELAKNFADVQAVADEIEIAIQSSMKSEITSQKIGEMAMDKLRQLDAVAYVRFASVHREFKDIDSFAREISELALNGNKE